MKRVSGYPILRFLVWRQHPHHLLSRFCITTLFFMSCIMLRICKYFEFDILSIGMLHFFCYVFLTCGFYLSLLYFTNLVPTVKQQSISQLLSVSYILLSGYSNFLLKFRAVLIKDVGFTFSPLPEN